MFRFRSSLLVLSFGARHAAWGRFECRRGSPPRLQGFGVEDGGLLNGMEPAALSARLRGWRRAGAPLRGACIVGWPVNLGLCRCVRLPAVARRDWPRLLRFELQQHLPMASHRLVWDSGPGSRTAQEVEFWLAAMAREKADAFSTILIEAGLRPEAFTPTVFAFPALLPGHDRRAIIVELGAHSLTLLSLARARLGIRVTAGGTDGAMRCIAQDLAITEEQAALVQRQVSGDPVGPGSSAAPTAVAAVQRAAERLAQRVVSELRHSLLSYRRDYGEEPASLYFTGPGFAEWPIARVVEEQLQRRFTALTDRVDLERDDFPRSAALVELAALAHAANEPDLPGLDLSPPSWRQVRSRRRRAPWHAATLLLLGLALLPWGLHYGQATRAADAARQALDEQRVVQEQARAHNETTVAEIGRLQRAVAEVLELTQGRDGWIRLLDDLQSRLHASAAHSWIESLTVLPPAEVSGPAVHARRGPSWLDPRTEALRAPREAGAPLRVGLTIRLLESAEAGGPLPTEMFGHGKRVVDALAASPFVEKVEGERFDPTRLDLLRVDVFLVLRAEALR